MKHEIKTMHLFAGHGGGLLADLILGHTPVVAVEWDGYACQILRERAADGWFPNLRVWEGDVQLFDPSEYAGKVDCIHAGFPCQDISTAGKQAGVSEGTRSGLYREVLRIASVVRPKQLFLENVSAILSNGLGTVLGDLASMGYDTRWCCIRASDVGAPHHRDRWFLLANTKGERSNGGNNNSSISMGQQPISESGDNCRPSDVANTNSTQRQGDGLPSGIHTENNSIRVNGQNVADSKCQRQPGQGQHEQPSNSAQGRDWQATEFEHGSSSNFWATEPDLGRVANGVPSRVHRLKGLGNAQVPLQAATAYRLLGGK